MGTLSRDTRRVVSNHLREFAPQDDPEKRPEPDPLPVIGSMLARPEERETFAELARTANHAQLHALRDPTARIPDGLAGLGAEDRQRIAATFRAAPVPDREDTAPDPRLADDVLVLSCAVSECIDADAPLHRSTLPRDVEAAMRDAAQATNVPEAEVEELAFGIARKRAETELRGDVASSASIRMRVPSWRQPQGFIRPLFRRAIDASWWSRRPGSSTRNPS